MLAILLKICYPREEADLWRQQWSLDKKMNKKRRRVALILSFIYCGLGQVREGEILKGINFIAIYTLLMVSFFFFSSSATPLVRFFGFSILLLMWFMGMVDAYIDDEILKKKKRRLIWQKLLSVLPVAVISGAVIALLMLWTQNFSAPGGMRTRNRSNSPVFFSIQVAAFRDNEKERWTYLKVEKKGMYGKR